jgi:Lrp/AsnC family transcriptional regulator for asnA, asnC and gidA
LAREIGLGEATISARVRSLIERRLLGITAVFDWQMAGYNRDVWISVTTDGRSLRDIGGELAKIAGIHSVSLVFGPVDFILHGFVRGIGDDADQLAQRVRDVDGVRSVDVSNAVETLRYTAEYARLPIQATELDFPDPQISLDEVDRRLIEQLIFDGRQSNRDIARMLGVSEGTVRARLRRLEESYLLRIVGQSDPYLTGLVNTWTYTWVDVAEGAERHVAERLAELPEAFVVAVVEGRHNLLLGLSASSKSNLVRTLSDTVRSIPEVTGSETWEVVQTIHYKFQWVRLF